MQTIGTSDFAPNFKSRHQNLALTIMTLHIALGKLPAKLWEVFESLAILLNRDDIFDSGWPKHSSHFCLI